ncbi:hypothetical protein AB0D46_02160 [Streptomyces sp. NPDC048383]|uniref:hypothetical protein n=2 Tax=unclassified Streptomyces TaxID=2593676 RepID=UPI00342CB747
MRTKPTMYKRMLRSALAVVFSAVAVFGAVSAVNGDAGNALASDSGWNIVPKGKSDSGWNVAPADSGWNAAPAGEPDSGWNDTPAGEPDSGWNTRPAGEPDSGWNIVPVKAL